MDTGRRRKRPELEEVSAVVDLHEELGMTRERNEMNNIERNTNQEEIEALRTQMRAMMVEMERLRGRRNNDFCEQNVSDGVDDADVSEHDFGREGGGSRSDRILNLEVKVEKLGALNFKSWKKELEITLKNLDLWELIDGKQKFSGTRFEREYTSREKSAAYGILYKSLDQERKNMVIHVDDAREAWLILLKKFEPNDLMTKGKAVGDLFNCRMGGGECMESYIMRVKGLYREFLRVGHKSLDEELLVHVLLRGLTGDFLYVVSMINTMNNCDISFDRVCSILEAEWKSRTKGGGECSNSGALISKRTGVSEFRNRRVCFRCGKVGHIRENCRVVLGSKSGESSVRQSVGQSVSKFSRNTTACLRLREEEKFELGSLSGWLLDSGATDHVSFDRNDFVEFREVSEFLVWGSDMRCEVKGRGKVVVEVRLCERVSVLTLHDVLFVPDFACKVYSLSKGTSMGWSYVVGRKTLTGISGGLVWFIGNKVKEGFFVVDFVVKGGKEFSIGDRRRQHEHVVGQKSSGRGVGVRQVGKGNISVNVNKGKKVEVRYSGVKKGVSGGGKKLATGDVTGIKDSTMGVDVRGGPFVGVLSKSNLQFRDRSEGKKVVVDRGVQVSEGMLGVFKGVEKGIQVCKFSRKQVETDLKKVYNSILEVVAEEELAKDALEENDRNYSIDWAQMFGSRLNKNLVHASGVKHGVSEKQVTKCKGVLKGVEQQRTVDSGKKLGMCKNEVRKKSGCLDFVNWDKIEELDDDSVSIGESVECTDDDENSGEEVGYRSRYRFRGRTGLSEMEEAIFGDDVY
jgi:hypothetical protein